LNREVVERVLSEHRIELVRFETPDLNGVSRGKTVTADHFWSFVEHGLPLVSDIFCWDHECWVATGTGFGEDLTFADLLMRPDLSTFTVLPCVEGQARVSEDGSSGPEPPIPPVRWTCEPPQPEA
jgi:glutamine synthetase